MKGLGIAVAIGLLAACASGAALGDDQAAVAAIIPGRITQKPWGWTISNRSGDTQVIRDAEGGYYVSGPRANFRLIRREYGFAVSPGKPGESPVTVQERFNIYYAAKARRSSR